MSEQLEQLYQEAKAALKAKDYNRASDLLRQILLIDENYRDTSRLLAQTVKLRRRRWYSHPAFWGTFGVLVIVGFGVILAPKIQSFYTNQIPTPLASQPTTPRPTAIVTTTATLPPTPAPIPLTWKRVSIGQEFERDTVTALVIDPKDTEVLYVGMEHAGIYKSIDGGLSWHPAHQGLANAHVTSLLIDFQNPNIVYAGTLGGVFKTEDGGESWDRFAEENSLLIDPQDSSHLYKRDSETIYESTDQGKNWRDVYSTKEGCPKRMVAWAIHPAEGKTLFIVSEQSEECEQGLYLSGDGGQTWTLEEKGDFCTGPLAIGLDREGNYFAIGTCDAEYAYYVPLPTLDSVYSYWHADQRLYKESQNGEPRLTLGKPDVGFLSVIVITPDDPDTLYVAGEGIAVSRDGGLTWTKLINGLGSGRLQLDAGTGGIPILYVQSGECDEIYYPDRGWDRKQSLYISTDLGTVWDFAGDTGCSLIQDADGSTLYRLGIIDVPSGDSYGWIWRSADAGSSWEKILTPDKVLTLAADQTQSGLVYIYLEKRDIGSRQQYFSEDYGHKWRAEDPPGDVKPCYGLIPQFIDKNRPMAIDPDDGDHVLFIDEGRLQESLDSCESWNVMEEQPPYPMNGVAIDPNTPNTIYVGADSGAYISSDSGETWNQINDGLLGATVVYSIVVDEDSNVYAATPYGIFKLEDK